MTILQLDRRLSFIKMEVGCANLSEKFHWMRETLQNGQLGIVENWWESCRMNPYSQAP
jgi:hypothetical protein